MPLWLYALLTIILICWQIKIYINHPDKAKDDLVKAVFGIGFAAVIFLILFAVTRIMGVE